jgi:hypothetical protein
METTHGCDSMVISMSARVAWGKNWAINGKALNCFDWHNKQNFIYLFSNFNFYTHNKKNFSSILNNLSAHATAKKAVKGGWRPAALHVPEHLFNII